MTGVTTNALSLGLFAAGAIAYLLLWRWRKRLPNRHGLALVPRPSDDWTDEDVDRMLKALQEADEHDGWAV